MKHRSTAVRHASVALRDRIRQARELLGMARAELARKVGVGASAAVQWEQAEATSPSVRHLIAIAQITDVSFEWLATGRGSARLGGAHETSAIHPGSVAHDLFEEHLLALARKIPRAHREALLHYLQISYG